jgi:hypothetical protein
LHIQISNVMTIYGKNGFSPIAGNKGKTRWLSAVWEDYFNLQISYSSILLEIETVCYNRDGLSVSSM